MGRDINPHNVAAPPKCWRQSARNDVRKEKLELLGGQSWTLLTPNRKGLSPLPEDIFYSHIVDPDLQVGLVWARVPQFRIIYHPNNTIALGLSLGNSEQYIGGSAGGSLVTLPSGLVSAYANELNNDNTSLTVPNLHPDIIPRSPSIRRWLITGSISKQREVRTSRSIGTSQRPGSLRNPHRELS